MTTISRMIFSGLLSLTVCWPVFAQTEVGEDLHCLFVPSDDHNVRWFEWSGANSMLMRHLNKVNYALLDQRSSAVASLHTRDHWLRRQQYIRQTLHDVVGAFPERTPLNARITGTIQKDGFRIEKLVYESLPGFYVTAALFVPNGITQPRPAVLKVIGHSAESFRRAGYMNVILNLVAKGFVVMTIDPLGQGERWQYYDSSTKKDNTRSEVSPHSSLANQCLLTGVSLGRYFIWDGIRAIDYLISRPEVDPARIGVTGLSGGGTQSALIAAMDDRVLAAAPTCYITGYRRLLAALGPQDGEQNFYHGLALGIDHADLLVVRAPRPTLPVATTRDYFSIQGFRETTGEARRAFAALGASGNFGTSEDDYTHGFTRKNNEATYAFFQQHLNLPGDPAERDIPFPTAAELTVTETGQVASSLGGRTVFDINQAEAAPLFDRMAARRKNPEPHVRQVLPEARRLSGYQDPAAFQPEPVFRGRYQREGYTIEKYVIQGEGETVVPLLLFLPGSAGPHPAVVYLHPEGKAADAAIGGAIEDLVLRGFIVAAPDVLGTGETAHDLWRTHELVAPFYNAMLAGRSIVAIQAGDVIRVVGCLRNRVEVDRNKIAVAAIGDLGPAALHAAAFSGEITGLMLAGSPMSWEAVVNNRYYNIHANAFVAGALTVYDLPDLIGSLAPRKAALLGPCDQMHQPASKEMIDASLAFPRRVFETQGVAGNLMVRESRDRQGLADAAAWCLK